MPEQAEAEPTIDRITAAVQVIDQCLAVGGHRSPLSALRDRIVGELIGDPDLAIGALSEDFELVMHAGGTTSVVARPAVVQSLLGITDTVGASILWIEIDDLTSGPTTVTLDGRLCTMKRPELAGRADLGARDAVISVTPVAIFCRCVESAMVTEVLHLGGGTETLDFRDVDLPSVGAIQAAIPKRAV